MRCNTFTRKDMEMHAAMTSIFILTRLEGLGLAAARTGRKNCPILGVRKRRWQGQFAGAGNRVRLEDYPGRREESRGLLGPRRRREVKLPGGNRCSVEGKKSAGAEEGSCSGGWWAARKSS